MLELHVPSREFFNDQNQEFIYTKATVVRLEHSLLAIAKWESKWKQPFLSQHKASSVTPAQLLDYFNCMLLEPSDEPNWLFALDENLVRKIEAYIKEEQTATTFYSLRKDKAKVKETITSEVIYYWMASLGIPFTCETWHLSRLLTLIHVGSIKSQTGKKMSKREIMETNHSLNEKRKRQYNTKG